MNNFRYSGRQIRAGVAQRAQWKRGHLGQLFVEE